MRTTRNSIVRHSFQIGTLLLIAVFLIFKKDADPEAYCPLGGLQTLATYLTRGSLACSMTTVQIMMGLFLAVGVILFGKLFCSYLCPLGTLSEGMLRLRRRLKIRKYSIRTRSPLDLILRSVKYILLFTLFYMTLSSSELFCKNFDPYYAMATGFRGEITAWMTIVSMLLLFLGSLLVDMFWCRYICPLGALSNLFKFTLWFLALLLIYALLQYAGLHVHWGILLGAECLTGYLLEILVRNPKLNPQIVAVLRNPDRCTSCGKCSRNCPYHIEVHKSITVKDPQCMLCGECMSVCPDNALSFNDRKRSRHLLLLPFLVIVLFLTALYLGNRTELPTIDVRWNDPAVIATDQLKEMKLTGMRSVKCYGSSMAFKARLEHVKGVYGVKTFVKHGNISIYYDPAQVNENRIRSAVYTPGVFRINTPGPDVKKIKRITIRTEGMYDKMDQNYLGLQLRLTGRKYYGLETEYECPLIVHIYMDVEEPVDRDFLKEVVEKKVLSLPLPKGGVKETDIDFEFVRLEKQVTTMDIRPYLEKIFKPYKAEFKNNIRECEGLPQEILEFTDRNYEKPIILRNLPYLSSYLSQQKGVLGVYLVLNEENMPAIRIRYCSDVTGPAQLQEILDRPKWSIRKKDGSIVEEGRRLRFDKPGKTLKMKQI